MGSERQGGQDRQQSDDRGQRITCGVWRGHPVLKNNVSSEICYLRRISFLTLSLFCLSYVKIL